MILKDNSGNGDVSRGFPDGAVYLCIPGEGTGGSWMEAGGWMEQGDNTVGFITINTNSTPFDLPISGTAKVCNVVFEDLYDTDNIRVILTPYNRQADFVSMKAEAEAGNGFELNTYTQLPCDDVLIYSYQVFEII